MEQFILALDQGTSSSRAIVFPSHAVIKDLICHFQLCIQIGCI